MTRPTVVIAGNGMVGFRFCRELVERAPGQYRVVVFGEEKRPAYDRIHLSDLLSDRRMDDLLLAPRSWYDRNGIELRLGDPLRSVDRRRGAVRSHSGREERFDTLVLATGADPHIPSFPGNDLPGVFTYRNASDLISLKLRARKASRAVILGGGAIGIEAAVSLSALGVEPHIIEAGPHLLARQLDPISAELVREQIERLGPRVSCGEAVRAIRSDDGCLLVDLDGGAPLATDLVVIAAGVRPRDELARAAGLAIDARRGGVAVDDQLTTSDSRILAIGDCARHAGTTYGLVGPGYEMARTLARRLAGESDACFTGGSPDFRLSVGGIEIAALGDHSGGGRPLVFQDGYQRRTLVLRGGSVVGVRAIGRWEGLPAVERAMETGRQLTGYEIERFCRTGDPWPPGRQPTVSIELWSDTDLACHCTRVTCGAIRQEVARGCTTIAELGARTGAGTVCGACRPVLAQLCGDSSPAAVAPSRGRWSLASLSVAALFACAGFLALGPPSLVGALSPVRWLSRFWYAGQDKMLSGFVLAGVAALTLLFGLYRRVPRLVRSGRGPLLRAAHAGVGLAAVLLLIAHTGMHVGDNLNRALLVTFLGVIVTGGLVGIASARTRAAPAPAVAGGLPGGRARGLLLAGHFLFFSVLPVLLAFHVIAVFYF